MNMNENTIKRQMLEACKEAIEEVMSALEANQEIDPSIKPEKIKIDFDMNVKGDHSEFRIVCSPVIVFKKT